MIESMCPFFIVSHVRATMAFLRGDARLRNPLSGTGGGTVPKHRRR